MDSLNTTAPAFIEMAHRIVWATVATVDRKSRPRTRVMQPIWVWDLERLVGWVATSVTPVTTDHLEHSPYASVNYWDPSQDTCTADCRAVMVADEDTRRMVWALYLQTPPPVGYDPLTVPGWDSPTSPTFGAMRLDPWHLRVFPGTLLLGTGGDKLTWTEEQPADLASVL